MLNGALQTEEHYYLVLEYAESDLFSYITRHGALKVAFWVLLF
jgi:hypothetical protein